jgi:hypothetical protein
MRAILVILTVLLMMATVPAHVEAQHGRGPGPGFYERGGGPYGQYCPGRRWGGPYGARKPVNNAEQAKQLIEAFFSSSGEAITAGRIEERRWFFEAEILDGRGKVIDKVIVDKRTGRIRSIY